VTTPHDILFRRVFREPEQAADLLRAFLPTDLARAINWRTLARRDRSFVGEHMREHYADLLFEARIGDQPGLLYLLLEHKSSSERFTALQVLG
jgi:predicted transposase/invertase (TIGR01784 family)